MAKKTTQNEMILRYLVNNGSITPMDALRECGCMRLASRISELKQLGYDITTKIITEMNGVRYAEYHLNGV